LGIPPVRHPVANSKVDALVIQFEHVSKRYNTEDLPALDDVDLTIDDGEFTFLVGPSGSGKSTFLRLLLREDKPTDGRIIVNDKDIAKMRRWRVPQFRRKMGSVFQDFRLLPEKTVTQNVAFALDVIGAPKAKVGPAVAEALELVGLTDLAERRPSQLSGGEQQRVAIARAFVNKPPILIADEPTGNLDPTTSLGIMRLLERINRTGTTVIMATHDAAIVDQMRKRVIELVGGQVVRDEARGVYGYTA
jgi:cell division transport system ATP-binding protein